MFVYGCALSEEEIIDTVSEDVKAKFALEHGFPMGSWAAVENIKERNKEFVLVSYDTAGKRAFIFGRAYESMKQDETKKEFETSVIQQIRKIFDKDLPTSFIKVYEDYY